MIRNYIIIAWRNLKKSKFFSILNIVGLSIGMACSILILLWVQNEVSYDNFHTDSERIYRFTTYVDDFKAAVSSAGMSPDLQRELPEIETVVRTTKFKTVLFDVNNNVYEEERFMFVDSNFFEFFDFPLLSGNKFTALKEPNTILLTESMKKKYFGEEEALGKSIKLNDEINLSVSGVLKDLPSNSHFKFDFISPISTIASSNKEIAEGIWDSFNYYSYFKLDENISSSGASVGILEDKINGIWADRMDNDSFGFKLQPLEDIHLYSNLQLDVEGHGNILYVNIFFIAAIFILIVACINFMNLSTAHSANRSKEVGLRKAVGANRSQLIWQFLSESILISIISLIIAIGLVFLTLPFFNEISGRALTIDVYNAKYWMMLLAIAIVTGIFSGSYPALYLSGFNPVKVLQGKLNVSGGNLFFRNSLVITQFVVSAFLIVCTIVIYNQLQFIKNKNLGFDKSNIIIVPLKGELVNQQDALRLDLIKNPLLEKYTIFQNLPKNVDTGTTDVYWEGRDTNKGVVIPDMRIDEKFLGVFQMKILAGRGFSKDFSVNDLNFVINETLMKLMDKNLDNIIGKKLKVGGDGTVIGVVKDFHFKPLQYDIEPLVISEKTDGKYLAIRTTMNQTQASITALQSIHSELNPAFPFTYSFLDQDIENLYDSEQQMGKIFNIFSLLAIFISCLGIFGLSAFIAEQRTREIGIRKVLGARLISLVYLLSSDFFKLVLIGFVISIPLSWYYLDKWLQEFAFQINISWWIFPLSGIGIFTITLLTVSYQAIKAASANPVKSLRTE